MTTTTTTAASRAALALALALAVGAAAGAWACSSKPGRRAAVGDDGGVVAAGDAAVADAAPDPRAFRRALERGRERARGGDPAGAIAAFEEALAARPDDARVLSELSWAALLAGDLARAEAAASRSVELAADDPRLAAASLYNLGRALEARGDAASALDAYRRSLALRPHHVVERRVRALEAPGEAWTEAPLPLAGPFADLAAFCASLGLDDDDVTADAWCAPEGAPVAAPALPAPFTRVEVIRHAEAPGDTRHDLALRTAAGWWVLADFGDEGPWIATSIVAVEVAHGRLLIRSRTAQDQGDPYRADHVTVCGAGASGAPSCLGPLLVRRTSGPADTVELDYRVSLRPGDRLAIVPLTRDPDRDLAGEHRLVFP